MAVFRLPFCLPASRWCMGHTPMCVLHTFVRVECWRMRYLNFLKFFGDDFGWFIGLVVSNVHSYYLQMIIFCDGQSH